MGVFACGWWGLVFAWVFAWVVCALAGVGGTWLSHRPSLSLVGGLVVLTRLVWACLVLAWRFCVPGWEARWGGTWLSRPMQCGVRCSPLLRGVEERKMVGGARSEW